MSEQWTLEKVNQLITNMVQESLNLEYKSSGALENTPKNKTDITKDVSAMANSTGGTIIYGIKEYDEEDKKHLPEKIDAIDQSKITKEWLDQVINTISPKIDGIIITPISIDISNLVVYVLEIPQAITAHQAQDLRYYKRYNFMIEAMHDYEIRDIMGRNKNPKFELSFLLENKTVSYTNTEVKTAFTLYITAKNIGAVYANYVNAFIAIPSYMINKDYLTDVDLTMEDGVKYVKLIRYNTVTDIMENGTLPKQFSSLYGPILPGLSITWAIPLKEVSQVIPRGYFESHLKIKWAIHADNAIPTIGEIALDDIKFQEPSHA